MNNFDQGPLFMPLVASMWQCCPVCKGQGTVLPAHSTLTTGIPQPETCTVCNGAKIISTLNGAPPTFLQLDKGTSTDRLTREVEEILGRRFLAEEIAFYILQHTHDQISDPDTLTQLLHEKLEALGIGADEVEDKNRQARG